MNSHPGRERSVSFFCLFYLKKCPRFLLTIVMAALHAHQLLETSPKFSFSPLSHKALCKPMSSTDMLCLDSEGTVYEICKSHIWLNDVLSIYNQLLPGHLIFTFKFLPFNNSHSSHIHCPISMQSQLFKGTEVIIPSAFIPTLLSCGVFTNTMFHGEVSRCYPTQNSKEMLFSCYVVNRQYLKLQSYRSCRLKLWKNFLTKDTGKPL